MTALKLTAFIGEKPHIIPRLLPETAAQAAIDVRLDDGGLTPTRLAVQVDKLADSGMKTIYRHGETWLGWADVVNAAPGPVADDRLYYTGDGAPKIRIDGDVYALAVPRPTDKPTITVSGDGDGDIVTRTYAWTWVTDFGEESEPSPAADPVDWTPGQTVTVSGFSVAPTGRAITKQRIYRSQTGKSGTTLYFIAERDASDDDFTDDVGVDDFDEPLPSTDWNAPPDELGGLIALPNGMMAAFVGRKLYFCEPYHPHAWPEKYILTTDFDIVGLGAIGTAMIVMTKGNPYLVSGAAPESMQMVKLEANLPCINARGIADLGFAIAYPSVEGLVVARADGSIGIASAQLFSRDEWLAYSPSTFVAGQIAGRYVAFYDTIDAAAKTVAGALLISVGDQPFLVRSAARATAVVDDVTDSGLYFQRHDNANIYRFDAPAGARSQMYWRSKPFVLPYADNFGAILVDSSDAYKPQDDANLEQHREDVEAANADRIAAGPLGGAFSDSALNMYPLDGDVLAPIPAPPPGVLTVGVYADGNRVATINRIGKAIRLPSGFKARKWEVDVAGDTAIDQITLGRTMDDLKTVAP